MEIGNDFRGGLIWIGVLEGEGEVIGLFWKKLAEDCVVIFV